MAYRLIDEEVGISELEGMVQECCSYDDSLEEYYIEIIKKAHTLLSCEMNLGRSY